MGTLPVQFQSDGSAQLSATVEATFYPEGDGDPSATSLRMQGLVDPASLSANVEVWVTDALYALHTDQPDTNSGLDVARHALQAIVARDWNALYPLTVDDVRNGYSRAQFVQMMQEQQPQGPEVVSAETTGQGTVVTDGDGSTMYQQPITVELRTARGATQTVTSTLFLLREDRTWHFWSTDALPGS